MAKDSPFQTNYTRQITFLLDKVYGRSTLKDSLLDCAVTYFEDETFQASENDVSSYKKADTDAEQLIQSKRDERYASILALAHHILELAEADGYQESNRKSAQFLGSILLLTPTVSRKIANYNEQCKSVYKAVLSLRLLDRLIIDGKLKEPYITNFLGDISPEQYMNFAKHDVKAHKRFVEQVKVPLIIAALLQDIGNYHPKAQLILCGSDNKLDPFRTLDVQQRKELLQINYRETINYLTDGIGIPSFIGNTKIDRDHFVRDEQGKFTFIKHLLKSSINPKNGIGNLLKVPQIYTAIILSTKNNYNYKLLPQVFQVLNKNAELGSCSQAVVDSLYKITGMFPQGFGIVYMPAGDFTDSADCYEYAIVNGLYPNKPEEPICRMTTRKLTFIGYGQNCVVKVNKNLYFTQTAKKLARLSKERLHEILALLSSNFEERKKLDLLPRCWYANEFFSIKAHQNLWNKND